MTEGLLASLVLTLWVLWTSWAVKLEQGERTRRDPRTATPVGARTAAARPARGRAEPGARRTWAPKVELNRVNTSDTLAPCEFPRSPTTHCVR